MKTKKSSLLLVAFAAASTPALADINVTTEAIDWTFRGHFDVGFRVTRHDDPAQSRTAFAANNTSPSHLIGSAAINFRKDWKGIILLEIDPDPTHSNRQNQAVGANIFNGSPSQGQQYVGVASPYGTVKLGIPDSYGFFAGLTATPFGTGIGGGYEAATPFTRLGTTAVTGVNSYVGGGVGRVIRHERTMSYETPNFGGLVGQIEYSPGNDNAADGSANNNNRWLGVGARYAKPNGPVIVLWHGEAEAGGNRAAGTTPPSSTTQVPSGLAADQSVKFTMLGANYPVLPNLRLYAGWTSTSTSNEIERSSSWNVAGKYTLNRFDFMANYLVRSANSGINAPAANRVPKGRLAGLGVDYRFSDSPVNVIYWRFHRIDKVNVAGQAIQANAIGVRVGF